MRTIEQHHTSIFDGTSRLLEWISRKYAIPKRFLLGQTRQETLSMSNLRTIEEFRDEDDAMLDRLARGVTSREPGNFEEGNSNPKGGNFMASFPEFTSENMTRRLEMIANAEPDTRHRALKKAMLGLCLNEQERGEMAMIYDGLDESKDRELDEAYNRGYTYGYEDGWYDCSTETERSGGSAV